MKLKWKKEKVVKTDIEKWVNEFIFDKSITYANTHKTIVGVDSIEKNLRGNLRKYKEEMQLFVSQNKETVDKQYNQMEKAGMRKNICIILCLINGVAIEELQYPMEVHYVEETLFRGMAGTYQCGSYEESGVISIYIVDNQNVSITIGTHQNPTMLGGNGTIIDRNTVVMKWDGATTYTLTWSDKGIFTIQRDGSSGISDVDVCTDNVEYVNAEYYQVS